MGKKYKITIEVEGNGPDDAWDNFLADVDRYFNRLEGYFKPEYDQAELIGDREEWSEQTNKKEKSEAEA